MQNLVKSAQLWRNMLASRVWVKCTKLEGTVWILPRIPLSLEIRVCLSSGYFSHEGSMTCFRKRQGNLPDSAISLNSFSLNYLYTQVPYFAVVCSEPHQLQKQYVLFPCCCSYIQNVIYYLQNYFQTFITTLSIVLQFLSIRISKANKCHFHIGIQENFIKGLFSKGVGRFWVRTKKSATDFRVVTTTARPEKERKGTITGT